MANNGDKELLTMLTLTLHFKDLPKFWPTQECRTKEYTSVSVELLEEVPLDQIPAVTKQTISVNSKNQVRKYAL